MILVFDVGNTNIEIGIFFEESGNERVVATARRFTRREESPDELGFFVYTEFLRDSNPSRRR